MAKPWTSGFPNRRDASGQRGWSLLELSISLALASILLAAGTEFVLSLWQGVEQVRDRAESAAMWWSVRRILSQDLHKATSAYLDHGVLVVRTADGTTYRYLVNSARQFVRVGMSGGTAVVAAAVDDVQWTVGDRTVQLDIRFHGGEEYLLTCATLAGFLQ
jgi:prepilin-type N-terminal cleavage/methylation domain-containing protein